MRWGPFSKNNCTQVNTGTGKIQGGAGPHQKPVEQDHAQDGLFHEGFREYSLQHFKSSGLAFTSRCVA